MNDYKKRENDKDLINPISFITKEPDLSLKDFYNSADNINIDRQKGTIIMSKRDDEGCITMTLRRLDGLKSLEMNHSNIDGFDQEMLSNLVKRLLSDGKTQTEVAQILGLSQGYISKLARS